MSKTQENLADVAFILAEVERLNAMPPREAIAHLRSNGDDAFAALGGFRRTVLCGRAALDRLEKLAKRTLHVRSAVDRAFNTQDYISALGECLVEEYLDQRHPVDERSVSRMIARGKRKASSTLVEITHHMPCEVFSEKYPDRFTFGPIQFARTDVFLTENDEHIRDYRILCQSEFAEGLRCRNPNLSTKDVSLQSEEFGTRHTDRIISYFSDHAWVASVSIPPCHFAVSQLRAERAIDAALDVLRLFALYAPERLRRANASSEPRETHHLYSDVDGTLNAAQFYSGRGATAGDGWHEHHTTLAAHLWQPLQEAVRPLVTDEPMDELNRRLLDALDWFGQAVQETEPAPKVVKYAAALERLTMTGHVEGIEKLVVRRVLLLNQDRTDKSAHRIEEDLGELYDCRSDLMHGSISPADPKVAKVLRIGWEVTRWSIFEAAQLFALIRNQGAPSRKALAAAYEGGLRGVPRDGLV